MANDFEEKKIFIWDQPQEQDIKLQKLFLKMDVLLD